MTERLLRPLVMFTLAMLALRANQIAFDYSLAHLPFWRVIAGGLALRVFFDVCCRDWGIRALFRRQGDSSAAPACEHRHAAGGYQTLPPPGNRPPPPPPPPPRR